MAQHDAEELSATSPATHLKRVTTSGLEALLELSPDALVVVNQAGTIIRGNEQAASCFGYSQQELLGASLERLLPDALRAAHVLHRAHYFAAPRLRAMGSGLELLGRRKDGSLFPVDISLRPILLEEEPLAVAAVRDVSEQRQLEQRLRISERQARTQAVQLETIFETIPDALVITDAKGSMVRVNTAARVLFGLPDPPELFSLPVEELRRAMQVRNEDGQPRPSEQFNHARLLRGETIAPSHPSITLLRTLDGHERSVSTSGAPLYDADGHISGAVIISYDISEQRQAERERKQQAQQLELQSRLLDLAHDAILVREPGGRVLFWNKGAEDLYGWNADEARGHITHSLLHTVFPTSLAQLEDRLEHERQWEGELVHTCRNGRVVVVESRQVLLRDEEAHPTAVLEINRDITRRRQLEQQAQAAHAETVARLSFFQQLIDALPSGIYLVYGPDARLLLANRAVQSVWGATWELDQPMGEFLARHGIRIMNAQGRPMSLSELATLRAVQQGETVRHLQETIRRPDQTSLPVLVNAVSLEAPQGWQLLRPGVVGMEAARQATASAVALVVHQDVSSLKEAEALKDEFIGVAAHELRNPLGALKGFASMLTSQSTSRRGPALADWQREAVSEIEQATGRLDKLTEDLLDVTRLQAGRLVLARAPTDLVSLVRQQVRLAQMTTQRHTLSFETALAELLAEVDRGRTEQVLANLLSNAIKYSPQGGPITVTLQREGGHSFALLRVSDQGIGIPAEQQGRLFGRFVRAENARATQITGTGLGLYLSRELVEQHEGQIWFESEEGAGSTFFLRLPLP